jgi:hypothetical protein
LQEFSVTQQKLSQSKILKKAIMKLELEKNKANEDYV